MIGFKSKTIIKHIVVRIRYGKMLFVISEILGIIPIKVSCQALISPTFIFSIKGENPRPIKSRIMHTISAILQIFLQIILQKKICIQEKLKK